MKRVLVSATLLSLLAAGCIAAPEDETFEPAQVPAETTRIDGMTVTETHTDAVVSCNDGNSNLQLPPTFCAERVLVAEGQMGASRAALGLVGSNGEIIIRHSSADAWSFHATVRVQALTESMARDGLDIAWSWSHEQDGTHGVFAGPTDSTTQIFGVRARVVSSAYELTMPAWAVLDLEARTDNGDITAEEFAFGAIDVETDNGQIRLSGEAENLRARTDNGGIAADVEPTKSGAWDLSTDNGQIVLTVPEGRSFGYAIEATTDNGQVMLRLRDGDAHPTENGMSFRTNDFGDRAIKTTMKLETDNGQVIVGSSR